MNRNEPHVPSSRYSRLRKGKNGASVIRMYCGFCHRKMGWATNLRGPSVAHHLDTKFDTEFTLAALEAL